MNASKDTPYPQELLPNSSWADSGYHQNYTLSPPLLSGKIKPAACEQLHIAVEVWAAMSTNINGQAHICLATSHKCLYPRLRWKLAEEAIFVALHD